MQFETGYTFTQSTAASRTHSFPEALLRVGLFRNWFEVRVAQDFVSTTGSEPSRVTGAGDLDVGTKMVLSHQSGAVPDSAVLVQGTLPTGTAAVSAGLTLPSIDYVYSWAVSPVWSVTGGTQVGRTVDASNRPYVQTAQ